MSYVVAVRALCEFTAKQGDLDLRFTPSPTALEGMAGHAVVTGRRGATYQTEVSLSGEHGPLLVRGRADGYDPDQNLLEEIKTFRGDLASMPDNHRHLHWAQVRVYGHLLCQKLGLDQVHLALVYFDIGRQSETVLRELASAQTLAALFTGLCERFVAWAEQELAHRLARDAALAALQFPHPAFRPGQRDLAETIFKASSSGRCVMAQAPTGIGKTVGTLFPVLKAAPQHKIDKVFYLAAKTPGRKLALDAARSLTGDAVPLRVLELVARDKACEHPDKACHGDACPLAKGFYDRLPHARSAAAAAGMLDRAALRCVALAHEVCPYYLGSEMAKWSDLIVGDYNYYFDLGALLYGLTLANQWKITVLVDEAHNLVNRARQMYSAELDRLALRAARAGSPKLVQTALDKVARNWPAAGSAAYEVLPAPPEKLLAALQGASATITDYLSDNPAPMDPALQRFYFDAMHFARLAELFGEHSLFDASMVDPKNTRLCIRNILPAPFLKPRFALSHSTALFSATLSPWNYYGDALGLPDNSAWVDIASPFAAEQLTVHIVERISTRFQHRASSAAPIARLIAAQYDAMPGNYLAFFSSFDYLEQVAAQFAQQFPGISTWHQPRRMNEAQRDDFLGRFTLESRGIGFAVLGGAFGEGIDLPGARLIGAFIATLGLPQMNPVNEQIRQRMQTIFGQGYDYTYLYPGIQKVVQAAGRVIRTENDRGVVYLIDDRFAQDDVQALLPRWWQVTRSAP
ncbi:ATP-dependent DNA helicase [Massilia sp. TSP1-1-2]|uniref:ATP-dependent DNA helicase n=1 Tax=Massilia sp. TSP1-1-2 TaxID=2804649 RepID=UPI003CE81C43